MKKDVALELLKLALESGSENGATGSGSREVPFEVGDKYFIRTVTYFATGKVKSIIGNFLVLEDAAWIASTGRFRDAVIKGVLDEVEPVEDMFVNVNAIVDAFPWKKDLPREQK